MRVVRITRTGGPDVLEIAEAPEPQLGPGEVRVRHSAIGLNFIDTYERSGLYPLPLPTVLGRELAGVVDAIGPDVVDFKPGERVATALGSRAYADMSVQSAQRLIHLPDDISFETAAAAILKGMTAEMLVRRLWPLHAGETVLVHAAAGGVGSLLTQWLAYAGVRVIGTVGSVEKAARAKAHGCSDVILYRSEDVVAGVRSLTGGEGVRIVYDSVGRDTVDASLACLSKRGLFVTYGNASGPVPPIAPLTLSRAGSLFMTRPTLFDYIATPEALRDSAEALFHVISTGAVKVDIGQRFALTEARQAHEALEARATLGATILVP